MQTLPTMPRSGAIVETPPKPEVPQQELLQHITNYLESISLNLVQEVSPKNERNQGPRRQEREHICYNCREFGHGMYFFPYPGGHKVMDFNKEGWDIK